jgi:hypothetical protein
MSACAPFGEGFVVFAEDFPAFEEVFVDFAEDLLAFEEDLLAFAEDLLALAFEFIEGSFRCVRTLPSTTCPEGKTVNGRRGHPFNVRGKSTAKHAAWQDSHTSRIFRPRPCGSKVIH